MSVIIRLQNLPWTANARDIRNFFSGLSIPEGGVHIIGGEMGDAFIAFSTDEDARCAMLKDREKLMEVQVRLLLSSRAEMQKVIETARKGSTAAAPISVPVPMPVAAPIAVAKPSPAAPMPPIIGGLNSFLGQGKLAQPAAGGVPSFLAYQQQAGITLSDVTGRSRSRSSSSDDSDRERERERERDRGRKRRSDRNSQEREVKMVASGGGPTISPWAQPAQQSQLPGVGLDLNMGLSLNIPAVVPSLQSYTTSSTTNNVTNNYNLAPSAPSAQNAQLLAALQQVVSGAAASKGQQPAKSDGEPIAFANVNPYAQMYPQLFQQQQMLLQQQQTPAKVSPSMGSSPGGGSTPQLIADTCYIRISGMCPSTSYSDIRKYFQGLYIPHNGIKIMTSNGTRTGVAYVEFSRVSSAQKAVQRNNTMFRDRLIQIAPVGDEEFERAEERAQRQQNEGGRNHNGGEKSERGAAGGGMPMPIPVTNVLYVEDLPQLTTEQEVMKMFSASYTVVDILLSPSPNNRRECVAFVLFARESEAESALQDTAKHYIGFRQLRVRPSSQAEMQNAKEKQRRANEQLLKEEADQREELLKDQERRQKQQEQENNQSKRFAADPRRRQAEEQQQQQQQQQQQALQHMHMSPNINQNMNPNMMAPFVNGGHMPFNMPPQLQNGGNNFPFNMNNMNMNMNNNGNANGNNPNFPNDISGIQRPRQEDVFVRVHNCEYATRVHDLGELFSLEQLRIEHIEQLFNERNQSSGEFIVEFSDPASCKQAVREFHNRRFRGRGLRVVTITPQEIADRMNKPFMDYLPGGNGPRKTESNNAAEGGSGNTNIGRPEGNQGQQQSRRRGPSRFDDISNRNNPPQDQPPEQQQVRQHSLEKEENSSGSSSAPVKAHFNPFARPDPPLSSSSLSPSQIKQASPVPVATSLIPDKFNRPGCVVAMRNVPFKAELKDILRFFSDFKLSPDDIIRRFNDEGKPTGDTRVAFESPAEARSAFESRRRKQIFNRTVHLDII
ncbi:uncharacterized protein LOC108100504 [Drosophila ficusphila]|uniref:uncharacterized protein LOC108100504 n=1 Tax=Drosophila ficusphila TaxID=30025 RepID=UPI0007E8A557|nr:uncharacterized protein LOC108100504 [Drosophila ficusphila]XP_017059943.1 uncharacterized protein LOC108100504 [Drosophila ficusphila]XP_017059944.1 uncharacterized protein LOC108100504 [Drosophila ficusphila]